MRGFVSLSLSHCCLAQHLRDCSLSTGEIEALKQAAGLDSACRAGLKQSTLQAGRSRATRAAHRPWAAGVLTPWRARFTS